MEGQPERQNLEGGILEKEVIDLETLKGWEDAIDNAHLFGCNIVRG